MALMCGVASADTMVVTSCTAAGPAPTELSPANNGTLTCNEAGATNLGGALQSITISLTGGIVSPSTLTLTNGASTPQTVDASTTANFFLDPSDPAGFVFSSFMVDASTGLQVLAPFSTTMFSVSGTNSGSIDVTPLSSYDTAGDTFSFAVDTLTGVTITGGGGQISSSQVTYAEATATVTYDYADAPSGTPEPGTIVILGSGLVGLGLIRRKRVRS